MGHDKLVKTSYLLRHRYNIGRKKEVEIESESDMDKEKGVDPA